MQTDGETGNSDRRYFSAPTGVAADGDCGVKSKELLGKNVLAFTLWLSYRKLGNLGQMLEFQLPKVMILISGALRR